MAEIRCAKPQPQPSTSRDTTEGLSSHYNSSDDYWSDSRLDKNDSNRKSRNIIVDSSDEELEVRKSENSSSEEDEPV